MRSTQIYNNHIERIPVVFFGEWSRENFALFPPTTKLIATHEFFSIRISSPGVLVIDSHSGDVSIITLGLILQKVDKCCFSRSLFTTDNQCLLQILIEPLFELILLCKCPKINSCMMRFLLHLLSILHCFVVVIIHVFVL